MDDLPHDEVEQILELMALEADAERFEASERKRRSAAEERKAQAVRRRGR